MVEPVVDVAVGTLGVAPVGAEYLPPPLGTHHAPGGLEVIGQVPGEDERPALAFCGGDVSCGVGERGEIGGRDRRGRDGEGGEDDRPYRSLAVRRVPVLVIAHEEPAAGQLDHPGQRIGGHSVVARPGTQRFTRRPGRQ